MIKPFTIWFALADSTILERVQVIGTAFYPPWGEYIFYRPIDWPPMEPGDKPLCCCADTFRLHYTPQDALECEIPATENFSSKTFSPPPPYFFTKVCELWRKVTSINKTS